ncbi:Trimethylguanosine synthase [Taenia solium]|eukprot:TsM_000432600 transcript=TsM_000432600 gene=TsM_000432600
MREDHWFRFKGHEEVMRDPEILRWWKRRFDLFERFDEGIRMDRESWYSVTPEAIARNQAKTCACDLIVDACAGAGGNSIQFARTCGFVIGIDNCLDRLNTVFTPNTRVYGVSSRIDCICGDTTRILRALRSGACIDTVFMSPPWGGPTYPRHRPLPPGSASWNKRRRRQYIIAEMRAAKDDGVYDLAANIPSLTEAIVAARGLFPTRPRIAVYLPRNCALGQVLKLGWTGENLESVEGREEVAIEDYWLRGRRLAICAYIGEFETGVS